MIVIHDNGHIVSFLMNLEKSPTSDYTSYIEIDEIAANKSVIVDIIRSQDDWSAYTVSNGQLFKNGIQVTLTPDIDKAQIRAEYLNMINRLESIETAGAIPFTQTGFNQVVQAVKDEATYIKRIMKVIKTLVT